MASSNSTNLSILLADQTVTPPLLIYLANSPAEYDEDFSKVPGNVPDQFTLNNLGAKELDVLLPYQQIKRFTKIIKLEHAKFSFEQCSYCDKKLFSTRGGKFPNLDEFGNHLKLCNTEGCSTDVCDDCTEEYLISRISNFWHNLDKPFWLKHNAESIVPLQVSHSSSLADHGSFSPVEDP
jgi:hypothetical protein